MNIYIYIERESDREKGREMDYDRGAMHMCMHAPVFASQAQTDGGVLQYVMHCIGMTLEGSPGNDMLYFVIFAVLKSPEHLWVCATDTAPPSHGQWANEHRHA